MSWNKDKGGVGEIRNRGKPRTNWHSNITEWTGKNTSQEGGIVSKVAHLLLLIALSCRKRKVVNE